MRTLPTRFRLAALALPVLILAGVAPAEEVQVEDPGAVARSAVTTEVVEREPANRVDALGTDHDEVFYFTEIREQTGHTLTHRWTFQGEVMAEVPFAIGGPRWRVYSSKKLLPDWIGRWTVAVVDEDGAILQEDHFTYGEADAPPAPETASTPLEAPTPPAAPAEPDPAPKPSTE